MPGAMALTIAVALSAVAAPAAAALAEPTTVTLRDGKVTMPRVNLGTCCGSDPGAGIPGWYEAQPAGSPTLAGIDTAFDYNDQPTIRTTISKLGLKRSSVFLTSKVPAGIGAAHGNSTDCSADPQVAIDYVKADLAQLGVDYVDLVLLHGPCELASPPVPDATASNNALWAGLQQAMSMGLTRAIGVSNYRVPQLASLKGAVPSVNQCQLSVNGSFGQAAHDDATEAYCAEHSIVYESYGALKGCPFSDARIQQIATSHGKSVAQVCLRWVLQRGAIVATGTGANATAAAAYAREDLSIFDFSLTDGEMTYLNNFSS